MDVKRINELYKKQKEVGLTEDEKKEQQALRREYINSVLGNVKSQLGDPKAFREEREKALVEQRRMKLGDKAVKPDEKGDKTEK